ncbi:MAG TPA: hypothetical protein VMU26_04405 [Candidatus Polarisedimenticolia bacterium]|nr:hypothetical protein [Candidatus Polarisedimenticolia bacterium]
MTRNPAREPSTGPIASLPLKRAAIRVAPQPKVPVDRVSLEFSGRRSRSVRLTFLPKRPTVPPEAGAITFELSRVQAWALAQWIIDESTKRAPSPV